MPDNRWYKVLEDRPILVNEFSASKGKKDPPPRPQARNRDFWQGFPRGTQTNFGPATCFLLCSLPPPFPFAAGEFISSRYLPPTNLPLVYKWFMARSFLRILARYVLFIPFQFIPSATTPSESEDSGRSREVARLSKMAGRGSYALNCVKSHPSSLRFPLFFVSRTRFIEVASARSFFGYRRLSAIMENCKWDNIR